MQKNRIRNFKKTFCILVSLTALGGLTGMSGKIVDSKDCLRKEVRQSAEYQNSANDTNTQKKTVDAVEKQETDLAETEMNHTEDVMPAEYCIQEFPIALQMPELPTGCEITALTMVLNYYGFSVDKTTMASEFLPKAEANLYVGEDGERYGADMNAFFIGNPFSENGIICGTQAIATAANTYLQSQESRLSAKDITGSSCDELYRRISKNQPVVVWVTIEMADRGETQGWYTETGTYVDWSTNDHGAVLIGYTDTTVTIADPISGEIQYSREQFESVFTARGFQCVVIE